MRREGQGGEVATGRRHAALAIETIVCANVKDDYSLTLGGHKNKILDNSVTPLAALHKE